jgi:hypothetical protein
MQSRWFCERQQSISHRSTTTKRASPEFPLRAVTPILSRSSASQWGQAQTSSERKRCLSVPRERQSLLSCGMQQRRWLVLSLLVDGFIDLK